MSLLVTRMDQHKQAYLRGGAIVRRNEQRTIYVAWKSP
jgi:hypothetical protein